MILHYILFFTNNIFSVLIIEQLHIYLVSHAELWRSIFRKVIVKKLGKVGSILMSLGANFYC